MYEEDDWFDHVTLDQVKGMFANAHIGTIWVKRLGKNNNSKQQVYLAHDLSELSFIPMGEPDETATKSKKPRAGKPVIHFPVPFKWITPAGIWDAPDSKLCYYPQYPEVRFSGFLHGCSRGPSMLMSPDKRGHEDGRFLLFGTVDGHDLQGHSYAAGVVIGAGCPAAHEITAHMSGDENVLFPLPIGPGDTDDFSTLRNALRNLLGRRIEPWRLREDGTEQRQYHAPNAPGFTLEAELGIGENAIAGPDFDDIWELKTILQKQLDRRYDHKVTLLTPQPDTGWASKHSTIDFVLHYGHQTDKTETDEHYFTTRDIETSTKRNPNATVELVLQGFNSPRDFDVNNGMIALLDKSTGELVAGWTFRKLLSHWRRKHNRACYVPYLNHKEERTVEFGPLVTLGISTYFGLFLQAFHDGLVVFDPGDKAEKKNGKWIPHARSQFRTTMSHLDGLYNKVIETDIREDEVIDCR